MKDKVDDGDVVIKDCPTEVMWADILTKPKQGRVYKEMRAVLMNCPVDYIDETDPRSHQGLRTKKAKVRTVATRDTGVAKKAKTMKTVAPKRNAKGGLASEDNAKASVNRGRRYHPVRPTQECVGRGHAEGHGSCHGDNVTSGSPSNTERDGSRVGLQTDVGRCCLRNNHPI